MQESSCHSIGQRIRMSHRSRYNGSRHDAPHIIGLDACPQVKILGSCQWLAPLCCGTFDKSKSGMWEHGAGEALDGHEKEFLVCFESCRQFVKISECIL